MRVAIILSVAVAAFAAPRVAPHVDLASRVVDAQAAIVDHVNSLNTVRFGGVVPWHA